MRKTLDFIRKNLLRPSDNGGYWYGMQIAGDIELLSIVLEKIKPSTILEIGTGCGEITIWLFWCNLFT